MAAEIFYGDPAIPGSGDPTEPGATPATSDNLAQRNLLIIESANPGHPATRTVQHSFDIALPSRRDRDRTREELRRVQVARTRDNQGRDDNQRAKAADEGFDMMAMSVAGISSQLAAVSAPGGAGIDELVFFWNNLPQDSRVEVYLPSIDVDYVILLRALRRAPQTVRAVDEHTLSLTPDGVTYLPITGLGAERVAGLLTVTLPEGIKAGQVFTVDVLQMRTPLGLILGAFRLTIPVTKAVSMYARELRLLEVFEERHKLTPDDNRWHPILAKQVEYFRARAREMAAEAADECSAAPGDDDKDKGVRVRIILEKINVLDFHGPLVHGSGELSVMAHVTSTNAGGTGANTRLPAVGAYPVLDKPDGGFAIDVDKEIFRGLVIDDLTVEIYSTESDQGKHTCHYRRIFKGEAAQWLGRYRPSDEKRDPENVGDMQVWYRIERL